MSTLMVILPTVEFSVCLILVVSYVGMSAAESVARRCDDDPPSPQVVRSALSGLLFGCHVLCNNLLIGWLFVALWRFDRLARNFKSGEAGRIREEIQWDFLQALLVAGFAGFVVLVLTRAQSSIYRYIKHVGRLRRWELERREREARVVRPWTPPPEPTPPTVPTRPTPSVPPARRAEPVTPQQKRELPAAVPALRVATPHVQRATPYVPTPVPDEPPETIVLNVPRRPRPDGPGRAEPSPNRKGGDPWPSLDEFLND